MWLSPLLPHRDNSYDVGRSREWRRGFVCGLIVASTVLILWMALYSAFAGTVNV